MAQEEIIARAVEGVKHRARAVRRRRVLARGRLAHRARFPRARWSRRPSRPAPPRSTSRTPSATRCRTNSPSCSATCASTCATSTRSCSACTATTTSAWRWPTAWPRCDAGARQIECTINGIGERAGNCSLEEVVMALQDARRVLQPRHRHRHQRLYPTSRAAVEHHRHAVQRNKAIVGENAFAHEAGIHQDGMLKHRSTYEIMRPEDVGPVAHATWCSASTAAATPCASASRNSASSSTTRSSNARVRRVQGARRQEEGAVRRRHRGARAEGRRRGWRRSVAARSPARRTATPPPPAARRVVLAARRRSAASRSRPPATARWMPRSRPSSSATGVDVKLRKFEVRSVSGAKTRRARRSSRRVQRRTYRGTSVSTDIVESGVRAFLTSSTASRHRAAPSRRAASEQRIAPTERSRSDDRARVNDRRARCSRRSGTSTWSCPRRPTRRRCSTSTCTSSTK